MSNCHFRVNNVIFCDIIHEYEELKHMKPLIKQNKNTVNFNLSCVFFTGKNLGLTHVYIQYMAGICLVFFKSYLHHIYVFKNIHIVIQKPKKKKPKTHPVFLHPSNCKKTRTTSTD